MRAPSMPTEIASSRTEFIAREKQLIRLYKCHRKTHDSKHSGVFFIRAYALMNLTGISRPPFKELIASC
jgi:hypothetical protein